MRILLIIFIIVLGACNSNSSKVSHLDIENIEKQLFQDQNRISDSLKTAAFEKYTVFAKEHPDDEMSPEYLFRAANISRSFKKYKEAIDLYQKIIQDYPSYNMVTESYFLVAFVYDNDLNDKEKATQIYKEVAEKYPNEEFGKSAAMRLETIHLTDEELIEMFNKKNPNLDSKIDSLKRK